MLTFLRETFFLWLASFSPRHRWFDYQRWRLLRAAGVRIEKCEIRAPFVLTQHGELGRILIGKGTFINAGLRIGVGAPAEVVIGDRCGLGPNVSLETMTHRSSGAVTGDWGDEAKSIIIRDNCWLGAGVIVLGGVTIGPDSVVAAGSVVTRDVPPGVVAGGNPARVARRIIAPQSQELSADAMPGDIGFVATEL